MEPEKSKVLVVGAFPPADAQLFGGVLTTCRALLDSSFPDSFDLVLIDSTQVSNPPPKFWYRAFLAGKRFGRFAIALLSSKPDAVLLFTSDGTSIIEKGAMAWLCRMHGTPNLLFSRAAQGTTALLEKSRVHRLVVQAFLRGTNSLLCQSEGFELIAQKKLGFAADQTMVIENWSATQRMLSVGEQRPPETATVPTLLFLAWVVREKGIFELIDAVKNVSQKHAFQLVIAGGGRAEGEAKAYSEAQGLQDRVRFVGWVQGDVKEQLLKNADVLVLPSWEEGFPNAVIEAMAAKLAVVVTTVGAVPDLLTDRQEALLIPPKDTVALACAIDALLADPQLRWQIAERGHVFAKERFGVERGVQKLTLCIQRAIAKRRVKPEGWRARIFRR